MRSNGSEVALTAWALATALAACGGKGVGRTTSIVHTADWANCDVGLWTAPQFLTVQSGDSFGYSCAYSNQATTVVTVGETELTSETCMTVGYYFPAGSSSCL